MIFFPVVRAVAVVLLAGRLTYAAPAALSGTVVDVNGHPIRGARIVAVHQDSGDRRETQADDLGAFVLSGLAPGTYVLHARWNGFKPLVTRPVAVELDRSASLALTLELDAVEEHLAVEYRAPLLQTDSATVGQVISGSTAAALPLSGRSLAQLALLLPGVVTTAPGSLAQPRVDADGRPYVNGHREQGNSFVLDGVDANDPLRSAQSYDPSPEAVEEVRFETNNYSAEYGNLAGVLVQATLKSGTGTLRGSLFELYRPPQLAANSWDLKRVGASRPNTRQHSFGGTLGGPLWRDRVFFFGDYEGFVRDEPTTVVSTVPPAEWRQGDFSNARNNLGVPLVVRDPLTNRSFPGSIIPADRFSPVARALLARPDLYPLPNVAGRNELAHSDRRTFRQHQGDLKISAQPTSRDTGFIRLTARSSQRRRRLPEWLAAEGSKQELPFRGVAASWNHTFGVGGLNQLEIGFNRLFEQTESENDAAIGDANVALGLSASQDRPGLSRLAIGGFSALGSAVSTTATTERVYVVSDQVSLLVGRHQLKAGGELLRSRIESRRSGSGGLMGSYSFNGMSTGLAFADFLLGHVQAKTLAHFTDWAQQQDRVGLFVEDTFRPHPRLTASAGMRWSYFSPWVEARDRQASVDLATGRQLFAGLDGNRRALYEPYRRGFEPRLGLAWTALPHVVVRAGYGIVQSMQGIPVGSRLTQNPPYLRDLAKVYDRAAPGGFGFDDVSVREPPVSRLNAYDPRLKPQWTQQWNVFVERAFSSSLTVNVGYVGHRARRLLMPLDYNQPLPGTGAPETWSSLQSRRPYAGQWPSLVALAVTTSRGRSRYDGLQAVVRQRPSRRLELLASYTWSKAAAHNVQHGGTSLGWRPRAGEFPQSSRDPDRDFGPSFFDATHNFVLSGSWEVAGTTLSSLLAAHGGFPITVVDSRDGSLQQNLGFDRPDRVGPARAPNPTPERWLDATAFRAAAPGTFGNSGVGIARGPSYFEWNLGLSRPVRVAGRTRLLLRLQAFNVLNRANLALPARDLASAAAFGTITQVNDGPRQIEVGAKLEF